MSCHPPSYGACGFGEQSTQRKGHSRWNVSEVTPGCYPAHIPSPGASTTRELGSAGPVQGHRECTDVR